MNNVLLLVIFSLGSYLFGNINWAIIISKLKKTDIRKLGSGNPGTLNMSRNLGLGIGLLTFFLDVMKGALPVLIVFFVTRNRFFVDTVFRVSDFAIFMCGLSVVLGHIYPVFFKFKGGKGIASTIGVFLVASSVCGWEWAVVAIMAIVAATVFIYLTEFGAMGSFIAITPPAISSSIRLYLTYNSAENPYVIAFHIITNLLIFAICLFTWFAHRHNIKRMLAGEEHPTSIKEMVVKMKAKKAAAKRAEEQNTNQTTNS
ncbi:MAG: glycerol-3-phosphate acyltransferase [Clostridia bacterium]|nr:glycerol-3-phosphate acyltransferase [Clostridia bacterium]